MGRPFAYIRLPMETILKEVALEETFFGTQRIKKMLIRAGFTLNQDRLDVLIMQYQSKITEKT